MASPPAPAAPIPQPLAAVLYAFLSILGLAAAIVIGLYLLNNPALLVANDAASRAYFVLLVFLGLATAAFLFGAMRSAATITGTKYGAAYEFGGPVVIAGLVVVAGFFLPTAQKEFPLYIRLTAAEAIKDLKDTSLRVDLEGRREPREFSSDGEAIISAVPARFVDVEVPIYFLSKTYRLKEPKSTYKIPVRAIIYLEVVRISEAEVPSQSTESTVGGLVHPQFKAVYDATPQLGRATRAAQLIDDGYQAVYERADVIWLKPLLTIYVMPVDSDRHAIRQPDPNWTTDLDLFDDTKLRAKFGTPEDKYPPHGGVAFHWLSDPDRWKWIGWRVWYCRYFDEIYYQEFERGIVMGSFHVSPARDEGQVFVIFNDGTWFSRITPSKVPECRAIAEPFPSR